MDPQEVPQFGASTCSIDLGIVGSEQSDGAGSDRAHFSLASQFAMSAQREDEQVRTSAVHTNGRVSFTRPKVSGHESVDWKVRLACPHNGYCRHIGGRNHHPKL